jgi:hypothetical protein
MEKNIQKKANEYVEELKNNLEQILITCTSLDNTDKIKLENFLNNYQSLTFEKADFQRRKHIKNIVHNYDRCTAKRASGERCTRRKKDHFDFCGTHIKGQPHGVIIGNEDVKPLKKITLHTQDIKGIIYYIDDFNNVYDSNDIMNNSKEPKIIAKYIKDKSGKYSIPEFENSSK